MSENRIDNIQGELKGEEERLKAELAELKKREQEVAKDLRRVQSALSGMAGGKPRKRTGAAKKASAPSGVEAHEVEASEVPLEAFP